MEKAYFTLLSFKKQDMGLYTQYDLHLKIFESLHVFIYSFLERKLIEHLLCIHSLLRILSSTVS